MAYKKYIKRGGKTFGPYYYESYRDSSGKVRKKYVGTTDPGALRKEQGKILGKKLPIILLSFLLVAFFFVFVFAFSGDSFFVLESAVSDISGQVSGGITGLVSLESEELVEEVYESGDVGLAIIVPEQDGVGNDNKRMDFSFGGNDIRLYFDVINYSSVVESVEAEIASENETGIVDGLTGFITGFFVAEENTSAFAGNGSSQDVLDTQDLEDEGGLEGTERESVPDESSFSEQSDQAEIGLELVRDKVDELEDGLVEEIIEEAIVVAEDFDIVIEETEEEDYKWTYDVRLVDLEFMAQIDVTSDASISIWDNATLRVGNSLLSFSDLVREGYTVRLERPAFTIEPGEGASSETSVDDANETVTPLDDQTENDTLSLNESDEFIEEIENEEEIVNQNETVSNETEAEGSRVEANETNADENDTVSSLESDEQKENVTGTEKNETDAEDESSQISNESRGVTNKMERSDVEDSGDLDVDPEADAEITGEETEEEDVLEAEVSSQDVESDEPEESGEGLEVSETEESSEDSAVSDSITGQVLLAPFLAAAGIIEPDLEYTNTITVYIEKDFTNTTYSVGDLISLDPTLIIIPITDAEHLDENRSFISNIFEDVKDLDGNWSEVIAPGHFVRATFEEPLNKEKDITIYARSADNTPASVEVHEFNGTRLLATFTDILSAEQKQIFLTNLSENVSYTQEVFDLRIVGEGEGIEFDWIVDPAAVFVNDDVEETSLEYAGTRNIVRLNDGTLVAAWEGDTNNFRCAWSDDNGATWNNATPGNDENLRYVSVATNGTGTYFVAEQTAAAEIYYIENKSGGCPGGFPSLSATNLSTNKRGPTIEYDGNTSRYVMCYQDDSTGVGFSILDANTTGANWKENLLFDTTIGFGGCGISVDLDGLTHVCIDDNSGHNIYYLSSNDSFRSPESLTRYNKTIATSASSFEDCDISAYNGSIVIATFEPGQLDLFTYISNDTGATFDDREVIGDFQYPTVCMSPYGVAQVVFVNATYTGSETLGYVNRTSGTDHSSQVILGDFQKTNWGHSALVCHTFPTANRQQERLLEIIARDEANKLLYFLNQSVLGNTAPNITFNGSSPATLNPGDDYTVNITVYEANGIHITTLVGYAELFVNGVSTYNISNASLYNNTNSTISTFLSGNFSPLDEVSARVWAGDGVDNTSKLIIPNKTVQNSAPSAHTVTISSSRYNVSADNLSVTFSGSSDSDSDNITNVTDWRVNGTSLAYFNFPLEIDAASVDSYSTTSKSRSLGGNPSHTFSGKVGNAYYFDGDNDRIEISESGTNLTDNITVEVWFNATDLTGDNEIVGYQTTIFDTTFTIRASGSDVVFLATATNGTTFTCNVNETATLSTNQWYHVALVKNHTHLLGYLNGTLVGFDDCLGSPTVYPSSLKLGVDVANGNDFEGVIDEFRVYNRTLSLEQIKANFNAGLVNDSVILLTSSQTLPRENWTVNITPTDGYENGQGIVSKGIVIQAPSNSSLPYLNSTTGNHYVIDNFTVYTSGSRDPDLDAVYNITDWRRNGTSIAFMNFPFDVFNDTNTTDYSTFSHNASVKGSASWSPVGRVGGMYMFDGLDDNITISPVADVLDNFTVELWFNASYFSGGDKYIAQYANGASNNKFRLHADSSGVLQYTMDVNNGSAVSCDLTTLTTLTANQWYYVAAVKNGTHVRVYVNGSVAGTHLCNGVASTGGDVVLGEAWNGGSHFNGTLDEFKVYNRSLSTEQIKANYNRGLDGYPYNTTVRQELVVGENWSVALTSTDLYSGGTTNLSGNLTITVPAPSLVANATTPSTQYINTSYSVNLTLQDYYYGGGTFTAYVQYYLNSSPNVSKSLVVANNTNTLVATLFSGNLSHYDNITAEVWVGNGVENSTKVNLTSVIFDILAPNIIHHAPSNNSYQTTATQNLTVNISDGYSLGNLTLFVYNSTNDLINQTNISLLGNVSKSFGQIYVFPYDDMFQWFYHVTDEAGNANSTQNQTITLDTTNPFLNYSNGAIRSGLLFNRSFVYVNVSLTEINLGNITYSLYNQTSLVNETTYTTAVTSINWTGLPDEVYRYNVTAYDLANNSNVTSTRNVTLDTTAPLVSYGLNTEAADSFFNRTYVYVNVSVTEQNFKNITYSLYNQTSLVNETTYTTAVTSINWTSLGEEIYRYNVTVADFANYTNTTSLRNITLDNAPPSLSFISGTDIDTANRSRTYIFVNISLTEVNFRNVTYSLYNDTSLVNETSFTTAVTSLNFTVLPESHYYYNVTAYDLANNSGSTTTRQITLDTTAPTVTNLTGMVADGDVGPSATFFNWTVTDNLDTNMTCYPASDLVDQTSGLTYTYNATNSNVTVDLPGGLQEINISCYDGAGNRGTSESISYLVAIIDFVSPTPATDSIVRFGSATNFSVNETDGEVFLHNVTLEVGNATSRNVTKINTEGDGWHSANYTWDLEPSYVNVTAYGFNNSFGSTLNVTDVRDFILLRALGNTTEPSITYACPNETYVANGSTLLIEFVSDLDTLVEYENVTIVDPDTLAYKLPFVSVVNDTATYGDFYNYTFNVNKTGTHTIRANITDYEGQSRLWNTTFSSSVGTTLYSINSSSISNFTLVSGCSGNSIMSGPSINFTLTDEALAHINVSIFDDLHNVTLALRAINFTANISEAFNYTELSDELDPPEGKRRVALFNVTTAINFTNYTLEYDFSVISHTINNESAMQMYYCASVPANCTTLDLLTTTLDTTQKTLTTGTLTTLYPYFLIVEEGTTSSTQVVQVSSGGGGGGTQIITEYRDLEIIAPGSIEIGIDDIVTIPVTFYNFEDIDFNDIQLSVVSSTPDIVPVFAVESISSLSANGENQTISLIVEAGADTALGDYEIEIIADVGNPDFTDKETINVRVVESIGLARIVERIVLAQDLFKENPQCLELNDLLIQAQRLVDEARYDEARVLVQEAIRECKDLVTELESPIRFGDYLEWQTPLFAALGLIIVAFAIATFIRKPTFDLRTPRKSRKLFAFPSSRKRKGLFGNSSSSSKKKTLYE